MLVAAFQFVARLSVVTGVQGKCAPIKNFLRVCEKVILDYESDMSRVTDLVRGKMFCDNMVDMMKVKSARTVHQLCQYQITFDTRIINR